jgi:hypothetical protein
MPERRPPEQLDIPLVWEQNPDEPPKERDEFPETASRPFRFWQLWLATLADLGFVLACLLVALLTVIIVGEWSGLATGVFASGLALELAFVIALASLWAWRGTPGMLLMGLAFDQPLPLLRAIRVLFFWASSLFLAGIPLIIKRRGQTLAERLADAPIRPHSSREGA